MEALTATRSIGEEREGGKGGVENDIMEAEVKRVSVTVYSVQISL